MPYLSNHILSNKEFIHDAAKYNINILSVMNDDLKKDSDFVLKLLYEYPSCLNKLIKYFNNDRVFIKKIYHECDDVFSYVSDEIKKDKELILELLEINAYFITHIDNSLKDDKDVMLKSV